METECHPTWQLVPSDKNLSAYNATQPTMGHSPSPATNHPSMQSSIHLCPFLNANIYKFEFLSPLRNLSFGPPADPALNFIHFHSVKHPRQYKKDSESINYSAPDLNLIKPQQPLNSQSRPTTPIAVNPYHKTP